MTFGTEWGWGSPKDAAFELLDRYFAAGGNFIDTADGYTGGSSERFIGEWLQSRGLRDKAVIATKFTFASAMGNPNGGGNGRKNIYRALEGSLERLQTDYVDLYWLHAWDGVTPVEEVVNTLDTLVRAGKVRHVGFSDVPAWYLARAQTIAELRGMERLCALQLEYSLVERNIEREHVPAAVALGLGICPWSPLASGMLTGKYSREGVRAAGDGRLLSIQDGKNPAFLKLFTERNWAIAEAVVSAAAECDMSPAQLALAWVTQRPGVVSTIIGATKVSQLDDNLRALEQPVPAEVWSRLEALSRPEAVHPYNFFEPTMRSFINGGVPVNAEPAWYRAR
jgi:aryl-alcohol dehydrogenase-like predicted oxidoreductase